MNNRMILGKQFEFEASHVLPNKEEYGKCRNLHGHTYKLTVEISGVLDISMGWIMNFKDLKAIVNKVVIDKYDHQHLNNFFEIPTAEVIVLKIADDINRELIKFNRLNQTNILLNKLKLYETSNSYAIYKNPFAQSE